MNFNIPDTLMTYQDIKRALQGMRDLDVTGSKEEVYAQLPFEAQALVDANKKAWEDNDLSGFRKQVEDCINQTPVFDVILPTYPHDSFLKEIAGWFRREVHANSLIDISVRRGIGGGMVLRSKNRLFDMSLRPKIVESKDKIPEVLRRV